MAVHTIGPFEASITSMGPMKGILIPKEWTEKEWFNDLLNVKKHKITVKVEKID
jgi:hypothetical protein